MFNKIKNRIKLFLEPYPKVRGQCKQCGKCCKSIFLTWKGKPVVAQRELDKLLRFNYKVYSRFVLDPHQEKDKPLKFTCVHLGSDNRCSVHNGRPPICRTYPHHSIFKIGGELEEDCGYRLVNEESFEDILEKVQLR